MSWLSEIAHDQGKVTLFAAISGMIVGLTGASVALIIGWRQGTSSRLAAEAAKASAEASTTTAKASERTARAAGDRAIATMRLQWVQDLRKILSEYHSVLVSYESGDYREVSELGTHLDLMLNLDEPEQKALWEVADRMFRTKDKNERVLMDPELMAAGRLVLKREWQKIKLEQQGVSQ
ncbi:hypothetical protein [Bradyrhizobium sp. I1.7.5]|uniref:hypothetical protein n=1 Tax=Bradyrhizobium sp. I1.7.5 TaxID=3156363 RepID=UPI003396784E